MIKKPNQSIYNIKDSKREGDMAPLNDLYSYFFNPFLTFSSQKVLLKIKIKNYQLFYNCPYLLVN